MKHFGAILVTLAVLAAPDPAAARSRNQAAPVLEKPVDITVYRSPTCGCCGKWLEHMKQSGFIVKDIKTAEMDAVKQRYGVPKSLQSCHTAEVEGYVIEGHVPAADVRDLLKKRPPEAVGLAVPGMVTGTPGMEMGGRKDPFDVVEFDKQGKTRTFHEYRAY